jgi:hypothetical protein
MPGTSLVEQPQATIHIAALAALMKAEQAFHTECLHQRGEERPAK